MTAFAEVGDPVTDLSQLNNEKVYSIRCVESKRGTWSYDASEPNFLNSTTRTGADVDLANTDQQFAFLTSASGKHYIYSVGGDKFFARGDNSVSLIERPESSTSYVTFLNSTYGNSEYPFVVTLEGYPLNLCNPGSTDPRGVVFYLNPQYQHTEDGGNSIQIVEAGTFAKSAEVMAKIEEFEKAYTEENIASAEALNTEVSGFLSVPQYAVGGYDPQLWQDLYDACGGDGVVDIYDYANHATDINNCITALKESSPTEFSNEKVYKLVNIVSSNGYLYSKQEDASHVYSSAKGGNLTTVPNSDKWQLYTQDGRSFLYNQGTKRFAKYDSGSNTWVLSDDPTYLTVTENTNKRIAAFSIKDTETSSGIPYMHCSTGYTQGVVGWNADTDASYFYFEEVEGTAVDLSTYYASKLKCDEANSYLKVPANSVGGYSKDLLDALNTACGGDGVANIADLENEGFDDAINALKIAKPIAFGNDKVYKIQNYVSGNGYIYAKDGDERIFSSTKNSILTTVPNSDKWQLHEENDKYYLYNQGTETYAAYNGNAWTFTPMPTVVNVAQNTAKGNAVFTIQDAAHMGSLQFMHINNGNSDNGVVGWGTDADASNFYFVEVPDAEVVALANLALTREKMLAEELIDGNKTNYVGSYSAAAIETLRQAVDAQDATIESIQAAFDAVESERLHVQSGNYYFILNAMQFNDGGVKAIYENPDGQNVAWHTTEGTAAELWQLESDNEGQFYIKSVNTGRYLQLPLAGNEGIGYMQNDESNPFKFIEQDDNMTFGLETYYNNNHSTLALYTGTKFGSTAQAGNDSGDYIGTYNGYGSAPTTWNVVEASSVNLTIGSTGYATAYFPFAVTIPEGVKAYTVSAAADGVATLRPLTGTIPANTGVILSGEVETAYPFAITTSEVSKVEGNLLDGVTMATNIPETSYILANKNGNLGFYKVDPSDTKLAANKAYLNNANGSFFSLKLDGAVTGIQSVENAAENAPAYDLQGRRLPQVPTKGLYIQNGKKIMK